MQQQWWHEFPSIALLSDTRLQTIRLKVDMWLFQLYIQRGKKQDQGSLVLCIAYIQLTLLKELHSQRFHACKFTWRNIFFLFPLCTPPQIPPIFHFWTHSLPPKWIWSIITPWLNHETTTDSRMQGAQWPSQNTDLWLSLLCLLESLCWEKQSGSTSTSSQMSGWIIFLERIPKAMSRHWGWLESL